MIFLKLTRTAKSFFSRSGWLIAELVFVFLGLYGAFLLERAHDVDMDLLRKRQILEALVGEFTSYEEELSEGYNTLSDTYVSSFFDAYAKGDKPYPVQIEYGAIGSVNTGIWEALLQSGIEVMEIDTIQRIQTFFKKLQDFLDLFARFEELYKDFVLPESGRDSTFFYEEGGTELLEKYSWYANQLFDIGSKLGELAVDAIETRAILQAELKETILLQQPDARFDENNTYLPQ